MARGRTAFSKAWNCCKPLTSTHSRSSACRRHPQHPLLSLFPGDGSVSFEDFLGVLTDSHRLAQCLGEGRGWWGGNGRGLEEAPPDLPPVLWPPGKVRNSRVCDPHGLQTLFLETLFKLMSLGFVPYKSAQEVMRWAQRTQLQGPGGKERTLPHARVPRDPCPEAGAPNSRSVSWAPTCPRQETSGFPSCFGGPTGEMEKTEGGGVLGGYPLFSFKLLLQEAAVSAAELQLEGRAPLPRQHRALTRGSRVLLPGHAPQRPFQRRAGAHATRTAQRGCARGWTGNHETETENCLSGSALKTGPPFPRPRCAQPLLPGTYPERADAARMLHAEPNLAPRSPTSQILLAQPPQAPGRS